MQLAILIVYSWMLMNQLVYLLSLSLFTLATIVVAVSRKIELWAKQHPTSSCTYSFSQRHWFPLSAGSWVNKYETYKTSLHG